MRARIAFLAVIIGLAGCTLQPNVADVKPNAHVGTAAPALSGDTLAGARLQVDFLKTKTVLVFWAAWCGPCRHEQPGLNTLAAQLAGQVNFVGVDVLDHDRASAKAFNAEFQVSYPSLYDDSGAMAAAYEVDAPPSFVLVDQRGIVVARYPGAASESQLQALIKAKLIT